MGRICFVLILVLAACQHQPTEEKSKETGIPSEPNWNRSMLEASDVLAKIMPIISQSEVPKDKRKELINQTKKLSALAHNFNETQHKPGQDPSLVFASRKFKAEVGSALHDLEIEAWGQGVRSLQRATRTCVACHTMKDGISFPMGAGVNPQLESLNSIQKADFYASVRQFDRAMVFYEEGLVNADWARNHEAEWNSAVQRLLAISVRVRENPSLTMEMISRFFDSGTYPQTLKLQARQWRAHTKDWRTEDSTKKKPLSSEEQINKAATLIDKANQLKDQQGFILYLRASGFLHQVLAQPLSNSAKVKALYFAGQASEGMKNANFWTFPEDFYESCVALDKKQEWKTKCNERLKMIRDQNAQAVH